MVKRRNTPEADEKTQQALASVIQAMLTEKGMTITTWAQSHDFVPNTAQLWFRTNKWPQDALDALMQDGIVTAEQIDTCDFTKTARLRLRNKQIAEGMEIDTTLGETIREIYTLLQKGILQRDESIRLITRAIQMKLNGAINLEEETK